MTEDKKKDEKDQPAEEPYPDLGTALHGEYILFRNDLLTPAPKTSKDKPSGTNQDKKPEKDGKQ